MGRIPGYNEVTTNNTSDLFVCEQQESSTWKTKKTTLQKIADAIFGAKTDNNLPHFSGTPTAGTTAEAIAKSNAYNDSSILCTATVIKPTLTNGSSVNNRTYYYKKGSRVFVSIAVSGLTANANQLLFTLPSGYRPSTIILPFGCDDSFNMNTVLLVKTDGSVEMRKNATQAYAFFEFDAFA